MLLRIRSDFTFAFLIVPTCLGAIAAAAEGIGHQPEVKVTAATRIDWVFALSNQSPAEPPADWLPGYDSTAQSYELYVPNSLKKGDSPGLILFISPGDRSTGLDSLRKACDEQKLIFASPHGAGNNIDSRKRIRIVLDVLDDVRREYRVDAVRTYIGGFSGGGRMACAIGFSLPEYFGGVIPVCAAGDLRDESWLRQRVIDRLSVAHLTGETDFNRGEVERFRGAMLAFVGVRSKVWVAPKMGHAIPATSMFEEAIVWLDAALPIRRKLAKDYPASRASKSDAPARDELARQLLAEGKLRLGTKAKTYSGLMQVKGVMERWPDLATADEAKTILEKYEQGADRTWEEEDVALQRKFLIARAKGLSAYATGPLPQQYAAQRGDMVKGAIGLWNLVIEDGQDKAAVEEGEKSLAELRKLTEGSEK
ncbi:MAG: hypothetical protein K8R36_01980 [Planctomycetales bacterium]|nr:hypothetical protein [Planctomycetales bacterium]